jgi:iron complex transport system substrate-binding protein
MKRRDFHFICVFFLFCISCKNAERRAEEQTSKKPVNNNIKYAKRFALSYRDGLTILHLFGDKNSDDTTATFVLFPDSAHLPSAFKKYICIKTPCNNIAALSSIYATMFSELGVTNSVSGIDNMDYVNNEQIINKFALGTIKELAKTPQIDLEAALVLNPDIIFTFGMGEGEKDIDKKLEQTGIPVAISVDHLEESPLARAEWIKFFAAFVNKREKADSIFSQVEKNYLTLKGIAQKTTTRPSVFNEIKYSDSWYMPGGKSYVAQLLNDAGANYLWKEDTQSGSLPLSFEQVYAKAKDADFWINLSTLKHKNELLSYEPRYKEFKAYKTGNLFNNTKITNSKGYSNYWETGMIYPNRILSDLIHIFHPELTIEINDQMYYYEQIK